MASTKPDEPLVSRRVGMLLWRRPNLDVKDGRFHRTALQFKQMLINAEPSLNKANATLCSIKFTIRWTGIVESRCVANV